jgi:hypothetical protein
VSEGVGGEGDHGKSIGVQDPSRLNGPCGENSCQAKKSSRAASKTRKTVSAKGRLKRLAQGVRGDGRKCVEF